VLTLFGIALVAIQYHVALIVSPQILEITATIAFGCMGYQLFYWGVFEASKEYSSFRSYAIR
jgi:hypothetical protein